MYLLLLYLAYILLKITTKSITISCISVFMCVHINLGREMWVQPSRVFSRPTFLSTACARKLIVHGLHFIGYYWCKGY